MALERQCQLAIALLSGTEMSGTSGDDHHENLLFPPTRDQVAKQERAQLELSFYFYYFLVIILFLWDFF
jgi:hypothetical protein